MPDGIRPHVPFLQLFLALRGSRVVAQSRAEVLPRFLGNQFLNTHQGVYTPFRTQAPNPSKTSGPIVGKNQENSLLHRSSELIWIVQEQDFVQYAHRELAGPSLDLVACRTTSRV